MMNDEINKVLAKYETDSSVFEGGDGMFVFVWINGRCHGGSRCLAMRRGDLEGELLNIDGVNTTKLNFD